MFSFIKNLFSKPSLRDTIEELIEEQPIDESDKGEREIIGNVLDLRNTQIQDLMTPKISIIAVSVTASLNDIISTFGQCHLTTLFVYQDTIDNIIGMVRVQDIISEKKDTFRINSVIKPVLFVPPIMKTLDLLFQMKNTGNRMAVVTDEYGEVEGIVSFTDLVEEIVGDIQDAAEIKNKKSKIIVNSDCIIVDGQSTFEEIQKYGKLTIVPKDDFNDTIGGMIISILGRVPVMGEIITLKEQHLELTILDADQRKIKQMKIIKK